MLLMGVQSFIQGLVLITHFLYDALQLPDFSLT